MHVVGSRNIPRFVQIYQLLVVGIQSTVLPSDGHQNVWGAPISSGNMSEGYAYYIRPRGRIGRTSEPRAIKYMQLDAGFPSRGRGRGEVRVDGGNEYAVDASMNEGG